MKRHKDKKTTHQNASANQYINLSILPCSLSRLLRQNRVRQILVRLIHKCASQLLHHAYAVIHKTNRNFIFNK